jgi:hypothetical protein
MQTTRNLMIGFALVLIVLTYFYSQWAARQFGAAAEAFMDYFSAPVGPKGGPDGVAPEIAGFTQPLPLADVYTAEPKLQEYGYAGTAHLDQARQLESGGQYLQRTNNYRREYPDNGSAYLVEFEGAMYRKPTDINAGVPCDAGVLCGP